MQNPGSFQPSVYTEESWLGQRSTALSCKNVGSSGPLRRDSPKRLEEAEGKSYTVMPECVEKALWKTSKPA